MKILIAFLVLLLPACAAPNAGTSVPLAPPIAPNDPIKTYAQYETAVNDAQHALPPVLENLRGTQRFVATLRELAKLPSTPSRRYAQALLDSLRKDGIVVPFDLPPSAAPPITISYAEFAKSDALTSCLSGSSGPDVPEAARMPGMAYLHMTVIVAQYAPSDQGAGYAVSALVNGQYPDVRNDQYDEKAEMLTYRRTVDALCARYTHPERPMNLTSISFFQLTGTSFSMFMGAYGNALRGYVSWGQPHPAIHNLTHDLLEAAKRARAVDPSPAAQKIIDEFIESNSDPARIGEH